MAKRKVTVGTKKSKSTKRQEPFALVYYTLDNTVGTVLRSNLVGDSVEVGKPVQAPLPIDYPEPAGDEMLEAVVIMFGYSVDYLEGISVDESGQLIEDAIYAEHSLARKKTNKAQEKRLHNQAINTIDKETDKLPDLSLMYNTQQTGTKTITIDESEITDHEQMGAEEKTNDDAIIMESTENETQSRMADESETAEDGIRQNNSQEEGPKSTAGNTIQKNQCVNCVQSCPLANVMKVASPENLNFLEEVLLALRQHRQNSQDQNEQIPIPENKEIELPPIAIIIEDQFKALPCYQLTSEKMALVENLEIYIEKMIYASIPHVTPQLPHEKGRKKAPNGSLYPRGMVKYLYELLVPEVIRKVAEPDDIPQDIKFVIKTYINLRLPPASKLLDTKLNEAFYDICRKEKKKATKSS